MAKLTEPLKTATERLFVTDRNRFLKLILCIHHMQKMGWADADIAATLDTLRAREQKMGPIAAWYGWIRRSIGSHKGERLQAEAAARKAEEMTDQDPFQALMKKMEERSNRMKG